MYFLFIRNNRRSRVVSALVGAVVVMVPSAVCIIYLLYNIGVYRKRLDEVDARGRKTVSVCIARRDVEKGEKVSVSDIQKLDFEVPEDVNFPEDSDIDGLIMSQKVESGSIITSSMTHEDEGFHDDVRLHEFAGIEIGSGVTEGSYIDIRIAMPDGEDFIVAGHKRIIGLKEGVISVYVTEQEILKMSSVAVDVGKYEGARVYATMYVADYQNDAIPNYPANMEVCQLGNWDPNVLEKVFTDEVMNNRRNLESNLLQYIKD